MRSRRRLPPRSAHGRCSRRRASFSRESSRGVLANYCFAACGVTLLGGVCAESAGECAPAASIGLNEGAGPGSTHREVSTADDTVLPAAAWLLRYASAVLSIARQVLYALTLSLHAVF